MNRKTGLYILVGFLILVLIANIYGFARGQFDVVTFWVVIAVIAALAYWVVPNLQVPRG